MRAEKEMHVHVFGPSHLKFWRMTTFVETCFLQSQKFMPIASLDVYGMAGFLYESVSKTTHNLIKPWNYPTCPFKHLHNFACEHSNLN